jgi:soluble lytic murein transglycosylase
LSWPASWLYLAPSQRAQWSASGPLLLGGARLFREAIVIVHRILSLAILIFVFGPTAQGVAASARTDTRDFRARPVAKNQDVAVPRILSEADAQKYRKIFALQEDGQWSRASQIMDILRDKVLLGHVEAQKYLHPTKYRSRYPELLRWMQQHADHPQASRLYKLATSRQLSGWKRPPKPQGKILLGNDPRSVGEGSKTYRSPRKRSTETRREVANLRGQIRQLIGKGWPSGARKKLATARTRIILDQVEFALARAEIAHGYFIFGKDKRALELADKSLAEAAQTIPIAGWTGGLAAWRLGDMDRAAEHFEALAGWLDAGPVARAAGAYWASRAHLAARRPREATKLLTQAATVPGSFYGLLARRALGVDMPLDWSLPLMTEVAVDQLAAIPGGRRGFALLQLGMKHAAEREFRKLFAMLPGPLRSVVMTVAARHGLPGLSMRAAGVLKAEGHRSYYAALFPVPDWPMLKKADIDSALIHAVARQESYFDARAKSGRGARGLMQLMPSTAAFVGEDRSLRRGSGRESLFDPAVNVALGGRYIRHLMDDDSVDHNLFKMLAAYNAGPGTLRKWERKVNYQNDPLFFIEAIPSRETRNYIENVLRNLWMYRIQRGEPAPSLDRIAAGSWPHYEAVDGQVARGYRHARN